MTDRQLLDVILKRAVKALKAYDSKLSAKNPHIVLTQQYGKKLYFGVHFENSTIPFLLAFSRAGARHVFLMPELPERLMDWKHQTIRSLMSAPNLVTYVDFDIETAPKEVVHIFFSAIISALNTPGMGVCFMAGPELFGPNETYEEVQVEADLGLFGQDTPFFC